MATIFFIILFLISSLVSSSSKAITRSESEIKLLYEGWLVTHQKYYNNLMEKEKRYDIFKDNLRYIDERNAGDHSFRLGLNVFADLTNEEYRATYCGGLLVDKMDLKGDHGDDHHGQKHWLNETEDDVPDSIDWRELGAVVPIKHQGACFSCWAFSSVAAVEGLNQIKTGKLISLSEQEIVDCFKKDCDAGYIQDSLNFIVENGGLDTEEDYPYKAKYVSCDKFKNNKKIVSIDGYERVYPPNDEVGLKKIVAKQPVAAGIEGYGKDFQLYESGIFNGNCGTSIDHAVAIVGYGVENKTDYWILKNSFGVKWGENGFMRIKRNVYAFWGRCGVAMQTYYPTMKEDKNKGKIQME
ncbi:hypothetical protein J5N97_002722 [Dioscorea zingiberensis]|uniref:Uncharacterized protein n=1 Tax=Dioscorea zingiberensis TaxID=325984 RepID=A0A9D5D2T4_9LILI|nr:hypothetical protein J5N97_002722 [Dioscorea zingiberensis]